MEDNYTNDTNDCLEKFRTDVFHAVAIVRAVSGGISVIASLLVILLIVLFKKYIFFTQRLILYLGIASMLNGLAIALQGATYYPDNKHTDAYCSLSAFVEQTTHWSLLLAVVSITLDIYLRVVHNVKKKTDAAYILVIFLLPIGFNWIPLLYNTYGHAGPWCWIVLTNEDCTMNHFGLALRYILWYVPLYIVILATIAIYIIVYVSVRRKNKKFKGKFDPNRKQIINQRKTQILPLIYYPIIFLLLQIPPTLNRIAELVLTEKGQLPFWFLHAFFSPLQGGLICIVYALDPETRARLTIISLKNLIKNKEEVSEYPVTQAHSDSISGRNRSKYSIPKVDLNLSVIHEE